MVIVLGIEFPQKFAQIGIGNIALEMVDVIPETYVFEDTGNVTRQAKVPTPVIRQYAQDYEARSGSPHTWLELL